MADMQVERWLRELESEDPRIRLDAVGRWAEGWRAKAEALEIEIKALRAEVETLRQRLPDAP